MGNGNFEEQHIEDELELARALTALLLAVRLENAETRAEEAYNRVLQTQGSDGARRFWF
jgi:hypothetical protein